MLSACVTLLIITARDGGDFDCRNNLPFLLSHLNLLLFQSITTFILVCVGMCVCMYVCMYVYIYIYTYTYAMFISSKLVVVVPFYFGLFSGFLTV